MLTDTSRMPSVQWDFIEELAQSLCCYEKTGSALAGVVQWIERGPVNQRVASSDSQSGDMPGLQARSSVGGMQEATIR